MSLPGQPYACYIFGSNSHMQLDSKIDTFISRRQKIEFSSLIKCHVSTARRHEQTPLCQWGAGNVYLLALVAVMGFVHAFGQYLYDT